MPYFHKLPSRFSGDGWKAKVFDKESGLEPPHVTLLRKTLKWRFDLRDLKFMDSDPPTRMVPKILIELLEADIARLREEWDKIHPKNPVGGNNG